MRRKVICQALTGSCAVLNVTAANANFIGEENSFLAKDMFFDAVFSTYVNIEQFPIDCRK